MKSTIILIFVISSAAAEDIATSLQLFSGSIYKELTVNNDNNFLISSVGLEATLTLLESGAVGETKSEIHQTLYLPETQEETNLEIAKILSALEADPSVSVIRFMIYYDGRYTLNDTFLAIAKEIYQASVLGSTRAVVDLSNDFDFRGIWIIPFVTTNRQNFYVDSNVMVEVDVIYQESAEYNYAENKDLDAKVLEILIKGNSLSMVFVLPNTRHGIEILEENIDITLGKQEFTKEFVSVTLPKFEITSSLELSSILKKMGVNKAFNETEADLSGIAGSKGNLHIEAITQIAVLQIDEKGINAPITTDVQEAIGLAFPPIANKTFIADHPFVFYIKMGNVILLEGRFLKP